MKNADPSLDCVDLAHFRHTTVSRRTCIKMAVLLCVTDAPAIIDFQLFEYSRMEFMHKWMHISRIT